MCSPADLRQQQIGQGISVGAWKLSDCEQRMGMHQPITCLNDSGAMRLHLFRCCVKHRQQGFHNSCVSLGVLSSEGRQSLTPAVSVQILCRANRQQEVDAKPSQGQHSVTALPPMRTMPCYLTSVLVQQHTMSYWHKKLVMQMHELQGETPAFGCNGIKTARGACSNAS